MNKDLKTSTIGMGSHISDGKIVSASIIDNDIDWPKMELSHTALIVTKGIVDEKTMEQVQETVDQGYNVLIGIIPQETKFIPELVHKYIESKPALYIKNPYNDDFEPKTDEIATEMAKYLYLNLLAQLKKSTLDKKLKTDAYIMEMMKNAQEGITEPIQKSGQQNRRERRAAERLNKKR